VRACAQGESGLPNRPTTWARAAPETCLVLDASPTRSLSRSETAIHPPACRSPPRKPWGGGKPATTRVPAPLRDMRPEPLNPVLALTTHGSAQPFRPQAIRTKRPRCWQAARLAQNNTEPWKCACAAVTAPRQPQRPVKPTATSRGVNPNSTTRNLCGDEQLLHRTTGACKASASICARQTPAEALVRGVLTFRESFPVHLFGCRRRAAQRQTQA